MSEKELPAGWVWVHLADVLSEPLINGRSVRTSEGGFPVLRLTSIKAGRIDLNESKEGSWVEEEAKPYLVTQGDYLLSRGNGSRGLVGRGGLVGEIAKPVAFPDTMVRVRVRPDLMLPKFLQHLWDSPLVRRQIESAARTTAGIYKVNQKILEGVALPLPPLTEQRRIAEAIEGCLSRLDVAARLLRDSTRRLVSLADSVVTATLGEEEKYAVEPLEHLLRETLRNGHSARVTTNVDGIRTLNLTAVTLNDFRDENTKITSADPLKVKELWLEPGDILIQRSNTPELVGTAAIFNGPKGWAIYPDLLIRVRTGSRLNPEFAAMVLRSRFARNYFRSSAKGLAGSMPKIDQSVIANFQMPVPPLGEQKRLVDEIAAKFDATAYVGSQLNKQNARAESLRKALLNNAFTGTLVPQDPTDEPATTLLARIEAERATQPKPPRTRRAPAAPRKAKSPAATVPAPVPTPAPAHSVQQEFDL